MNDKNKAKIPQQHKKNCEIKKSQFFDYFTMRKCRSIRDDYLPATVSNVRFVSFLYRHILEDRESERKIRERKTIWERLENCKWKFWESLEFIQSSRAFYEWNCKIPSLTHERERERERIVVTERVLEFFFCDYEKFSFLFLCCYFSRDTEIFITIFFYHRNRETVAAGGFIC